MFQEAYHHKTACDVLEVKIDAAERRALGAHNNRLPVETCL